MVTDHERRAAHDPDASVRAGAPARLRGPLLTVAVALAAAIGVLVAVEFVARGAGGEGAGEPLSPQELVDAAAAGGADGQRPSALADRAVEDDVPLPVEQLAGFAGGPARALDDYAGTPLVVNFWASWCPPCIEEMPDLDAVAQRAGGRLAVLGVNRADDAEAARQLADELDVSYDLALDEDDSLFAAVEAFGMPTTLFVDAGGTIVHRRTGAMSQDEFARLVAEHLGVELDG